MSAHTNRFNYEQVLMAMRDLNNHSHDLVDRYLGHNPDLQNWAINRHFFMAAHLVEIHSRTRAQVPYKPDPLEVSQTAIDYLLEAISSVAENLGKAEEEVYKSRVGSAIEENSTLRNALKMVLANYGQPKSHEYPKRIKHRYRKIRQLAKLSGIQISSTAFRSTPGRRSI